MINPRFLETQAAIQTAKSMQFIPMAYVTQAKNLLLVLTLVSGSLLLAQDSASTKSIPVQGGMAILENEKIPIYGNVSEVSMPVYPPGTAPEGYMSISYTIPDKGGSIRAKAAAFYKGKQVFGIKAGNFKKDVNPAGVVFESCGEKSLYIGIVTYNGNCTIHIRNSCETVMMP